MTWSHTDLTLTIEFETPYTYNGGNLLVDFNHAAASWNRYYFLGVEATGASYNNSSAQNFLPRVTFTYEPASTGDCEKPETLTISQLQPNQAMLNWEGGSTPTNGYNVELKGGQYDDWTRYKSNISQGCLLVPFFENTAYQVRVQTVCSATEASGWKSTSFTTPAYFSDFNVAIVPGEGNKAVFSWTENGFTPTAWQLCINDDETNLITMTSNPFTYDGLTPEVATTAKMRAFVGATYTGAWSNTVTFTPTDSYIITLNDQNTTNNSNIPITGNYVDWGNRSQFIIPATALADLQWGKLNELTFYATQTSTTFTNDVFNVYMKEVPNATFASNTFEDWETMTTVYSGSVSISNNKMVITFNKPFLYQGGNLLIGFQQTAYNSTVSCTWVGTAQTSTTALYETANSSHIWSGTVNSVSFLPKLTIDYTPGEEPTCFAPTGLAIVEGYPTAHGVSFTWNYEEGEVFQFSLPIGNVTDPEMVTWNTTWYAGDNFPIYDNQPADADRTFWLRKKCGDSDFSDPVSITFHFLEACPAPTGFTYLPNSVTGHTVDLTWEGTSESYQVAYRTVAYYSLIDEDFTGLTSGIPTGWDNSEGTTTTNSYKWNYFNAGHDAAPCLRFNSYNNSTGNTNFLKTPSMDFPAGKTMQLSFWWKNPTGDDFSVYISTDGGTTKTPIVEGLTGQSTWKQETFNLTDYIGATNVTIHFKGTSNYGSGDAYIYLDDVKFGEEIPAGEWQYKTEITEVPCQLTGLLAERKYEATLLGDCGNEGFSTEVGPITFKTGIACPAPTSLNHANVKSTQVDLSWTNGGAEDWIVAYKKISETNFTEVELASTDVTIEGTTVTYTLSGLDPETDYTVKVQDNCEASYTGDGVSEWTTEVAFSTIAACSAMDPVVSNITHYTATVNWDGESNNGFTVKYREAEHIDGISEEFGTSAPEGWSMYSGMLTASGDSYTATLSSSSNWSFGTWNFTDGTTNTPVLTGDHAKVNIYGNYQKWLVTPSFTVSNNVLTFDIALTNYYSNTNSYPEPGYGGTDDKFMVLVSTDNMATWNILREWNNEDGAQYVYNNINHTATGESVSISMSNYVGQEVYIAFYGESTTSNSNADNYIHIDNVVCGNIIPATAWEEEPSTENTVDLSQLTAGTKYDLTVVPNCDETLASEIQQFTTVSPNQKWFITEGNWDVPANWEPAGAPTISQDVVLKANATIASGEAFAKSIAGTGTGSDAKTLTIESGAKLKHLNSNVRATVKKHIIGYTTNDNYDPEAYNQANYYLIANPLTSNYTPMADGSDGFLVNNYDLYSWSYDAYDGKEWRNYEANTFSNLTSGAYGYLYANADNTDLIYTGTINAYTSSKYRSCSVASNPDNYDFPSWYLLGNPYMYDAYLANASTNGTALPYVKMNAAGDGFVNVAAGTPIAPMEGFFYQGVTGATSAYVVTSEPTVPDAGLLNMNLRSGNKQLDNAILVFGSNQQLGKMSFRANSSKVYMPVENKDYAIVSTESNVGEMPVSFKAETNGTYTIRFNTENVEFSYLHFIDNLTGNDVNLLASPSYSFEAKTTDYASRFRLVFATGSSADGDSFAFINGMGNLSIFGIEGTATVQVMDVTGRVILSDTFSGSYEKNLNVASGVYMIRLIQGENVKVQKMVVR